MSFCIVSMFTKRRFYSCENEAKFTSKGDVFVASEGLKTLSSESDLDERDVGAVHRLERKTLRGNVPDCFLDQVLEGVHGLLENLSFGETAFEHFLLLLLSDSERKTSLIIILYHYQKIKTQGNIFRHR